MLLSSLSPNSPLQVLLPAFGVQFCNLSEFLHLMNSTAKNMLHWRNIKKYFEDLNQAYEDVPEKVNTTLSESSLEMFSPFYFLPPASSSLAELTLFLLME